MVGVAPAEESESRLLAAFFRWRAVRGIARSDSPAADGEDGGGSDWEDASRVATSRQSALQAEIGKLALENRRLSAALAHAKASTGDELVDSNAQLLREVRRWKNVARMLRLELSQQDVRVLGIIEATGNTRVAWERDRALHKQGLFAARLREHERVKPSDDDAPAQEAGDGKADAIATSAQEEREGETNDAAPLRDALRASEARTEALNVQVAALKASLADAERRALRSPPAPSPEAKAMAAMRSHAEGLRERVLQLERDLVAARATPPPSPSPSPSPLPASSLLEAGTQTAPVTVVTSAVVESQQRLREASAEAEAMMAEQKKGREEADERATKAVHRTKRTARRAARALVAARRRRLLLAVLMTWRHWRMVRGMRKHAKEAARAREKARERARERAGAKQPPQQEEAGVSAATPLRSLASTPPSWSAVLDRVLARDRRTHLRRALRAWRKFKSEVALRWRNIAWHAAARMFARHAPGTGPLPSLPALPSPSLSWGREGLLRARLRRRDQNSHATAAAGVRAVRGGLRSWRWACERRRLQAQCRGVGGALAVLAASSAAWRNRAALAAWHRIALRSARFPSMPAIDVRVFDVGAPPPPSPSRGQRPLSPSLSEREERGVRRGGSSSHFKFRSWTPTTPSTRSYAR